MTENAKPFPMAGLGKVLAVVALAAAIGATLYLKTGGQPSPAGPAGTEATESPAVTSGEGAAPATAPGGALPKLVDLGATKCIPCKMMAPILDELRETYAGTFDVVFIDVWENPEEAKKHRVNLIPTQVFFDSGGKELYRHEGFFSREDILSKWKELGVDVGQSAAPPVADEAEPGFSRLEPLEPDTRPKDAVCYMCDGDVTPKTRVALSTEKGEVNFCSPHCYFIMCSSMVPPRREHAGARVADWAEAGDVPADAASYLVAMDASNRPVVRAFSDAEKAAVAQQAEGGNILALSALQEQEMSALCGFCDRAVYPADACAVKVGGLNTWGCCTMCALGVAARLQKDIEVSARDALTGEPIHLATSDGKVGLLEPATAVAWAGTKKDPEGKLVSTGCFKQAFFITEENLRKWAEAHPRATGRQISIDQALAEKMGLSPEQISKACKIGECAPK